VVIDNGDVVCVAVAPRETDPPLVVDADSVLSDSIAAELLQAVARWNAKVVECFGRVDDDKLAEHDPAQLGWVAPNGFAVEEAFGVAIAEALDPRLILTRGVTNVKRYYVASYRLELTCERPRRRAPGC
jgi:hypothetical protein